MCLYLSACMYARMCKHVYVYVCVCVCISMCVHIWNTRERERERERKKERERERERDGERKEHERANERAVSCTSINALARPSRHCMKASASQPFPDVKVGMHSEALCRQLGANQKRPSGHLAASAPY